LEIPTETEFSHLPLPTAGKCRPLFKFLKWDSKTQTHIKIKRNQKPCSDDQRPEEESKENLEIKPKYNFAELWQTKDQLPTLATSTEGVLSKQLDELEITCYMEFWYNGKRVKTQMPRRSLKKRRIPSRKRQLLSHPNVEHGSKLRTKATEQSPS
jgi:hypothetical protein